MSKITNLALFIATTVFLANFAGLIEGTGISYILQILAKPQNFQASGFVGAFTTVLLLAGSVGAIIGFFASQSVSIVIKVGLVEVLLLIGWDLIAIWQLLSEVDVVLATLVIAPSMLVWVIGVMEWWK